MSDDLAAEFASFAEWCAGTSPLYRHLAAAVAGEDALREFARQIPPEKSRPHVLFASVQYLLLEDADHPLAAYFPACTDAPREPDAELAKTFADFLETRAVDLRDLFETRRTQTNEVRRCSVLYPAFAHVSKRVGGRPVALLEVGPSAGLNLCWDRFAYAYAFEGDAREAGVDDEVAVGAVDAMLTVDSTIRGPVVPPLPRTPPPVDRRVGVDLNPLSVTDPADVRWLRALVWPEHARRRRLLEDAVAVARERPPNLRRGDALEVLPDAVAEIPPETPVCVFDTQVLYQLAEDDRRAFVDLLERLGREREGPLHWLSGNEPVDASEQAIRLDWGRLVDGALETRPLARYEAHGRWLEWLEV